MLHAEKIPGWMLTAQTPRIVPVVARVRETPLKRLVAVAASSIPSLAGGSKKQVRATVAGYILSCMRSLWQQTDREIFLHGVSPDTEAAAPLPLSQ
jgi:hypothetical protein